MKESTIAHRARLVGAGIAILALASTMPSLAAAAAPAGGCCDRPSDRKSAEVGDPTSSGANQIGFKGLASTDQYSEEGTLHQRSTQVDAEVGATEHDVLDVRSSAAHYGGNADWVVQALLMFLALAVISMGIRMIFLPSDRIPRIGGPRSPNDG